MKKRFLVAALLLAVAVSAQAQYSDLYYHRVGDTIEWRSEIGYYAWWDFEYYYANNLPLRIWPYDLTAFQGTFATDGKDSVVVVQRYYTPTPLKVVGLAGGCVRTNGYPDTAFVDTFFHNCDTNIYKDYFVIYDALPDSFPLVGKAEWSPFDPYRVLHVKSHYPHHLFPGDTDCCKYWPMEKYLPIYEYYFDSAIVVADSFYVGGTFFGEDYGCLMAGIRTTYWTAMYGVGGFDPCEANYVLPQTMHQCDIHPGLYKTKYGLTISTNPNQVYMNREFAGAPWEWYMSRAHFLIYPLIEVDTTVPPASACVPIENIQVTPSGTSATVTWDGFPNYSRILLRYGKAHLPQSQWSEIDVTGNTLYTLTNLEPMSRYSVTLKAECETSKKETPWSAPVTFYVADTSGGEGIGETPTLLSQMTFLQPSPAQDEVTVTSSFNLIAIDIWTADGVMVYHGDKSGHDTVLDVSYLRAGTYIVAIHTHNGTTHKKLQIVR